MLNFNYSSLFLATDGVLTTVLVAIIVAAIFAAIGIVIGGLLKNKSFEKKQGDIKKVTEKMLDDAREESRTIKKEAILEAKEQEIKLRNELEKETREKRKNS